MYPEPSVPNMLADSLEQITNTPARDVGVTLMPSKGKPITLDKKTNSTLTSSSTGPA